MEKMIKGLSLEELEGQRTELLPDRIEMRRRRRRRGGFRCTATAVAGTGGAVNTGIVCVNVRT